MRFFRNFTDLGGHSRGNPRSGLIFMGGGGGGGNIYYIFCVLADRQQFWNLLVYPHYQSILNTEPSQVSRVGLCTRIHVGLQLV